MVASGSIASEISRNGWKSFDFEPEIRPSYFDRLKQVGWIEDRILRCAQNDGKMLRKERDPSATPQDDAITSRMPVENGRVCPTNYEQLQPHYYIELTSLSKVGISSSAVEFYASGLSLAQISRQLNKSKSFIRKTLLEAGVSLRQSVESHLSESSAPPKLHSGNTPFGYRNLRGRLIMDAREIEIVHSIMELWTRGKSYSAIAAHLNGLGLKNRRATPWEHSLVRSIVERHKDKPLNLEEE